MRRVTIALKDAGTQSWWETGNVWRYLKMRRVALAANAAVFVPLVAAGLWIYLGQARSMGDLRRTNESLAEQIAKRGSGSRNRLERTHRQARAVPEGGSASTSQKRI